jgi:hypothetical protein
MVFEARSTATPGMIRLYKVVLWGRRVFFATAAAIFGLMLSYAEWGNWPAGLPEWVQWTVVSVIGAGMVVSALTGFLSAFVHAWISARGERDRGRKPWWPWWYKRHQRKHT